MRTLFKLVIGLYLYIPGAGAQILMDSLLVDIARNNKTLIANRQYLESQKLEFSTGLTPSNPKIDYDYLNGSPETAGNQTEFAVTQAIDFPTAYYRKKQLSKEQIEQTEYEFLITRQQILLEANLICIELVYRNKLQAELELRKTSTEKWLGHFRTRLNTGEGNVLEVNKAGLQLIEIGAEFHQNLSAINRLDQKLTELNGGIPVGFAGTEYTLNPAVPPFDQLEKEFMDNHPSGKYMEQQLNIAQKQLEVSKAMALPKLEAGYRYQSILGQTFNGLHLGVFIPLWENKNTVKKQYAGLSFADLNLANYRNEIHHQLLQTYEKYKNLRITLTQYEEQFMALNTVELLDKSLSLGEISVLEYFMERNYYHQAMKNYLETEMEFHRVIAELYRFRL